MNLKNYFERVVLINLPRRPDRLTQAKKNLRQARWPFRFPEIFAASDGQSTHLPKDWRYGSGAWGCLQSHRAVLRQAVADGVQSLLVLEDDVCFEKNFAARVKKFLRAAPGDWDQLMFGGQHIGQHGNPFLVEPGVLRCTDCERTHAYAVRGDYLRLLYKKLSGGGRFNGLSHCDWIMGRDPQLQLAHKVYAPEFFLIGQERSLSDVYGAVQPRKFWNPPGPELRVVNLHAPVTLAKALQEQGFCFGRGLGRARNLDRQLRLLFKETENDYPARVRRLREWIKALQWELAADPTYVCTVWHSAATPKLVKAASLWPVTEVTASTVEEAVQQLYATSWS